MADCLQTVYTLAQANCGNNAQYRGMYESIQGIAGSDAFSVDQLELGGDPSLSLEDGE